ncbi:3-(3-hydroxy-phenyl)propionate/3-hydroxycinnamic acid hydroxylase [Klebsiella pneumoniae]|nr:3-(3-hydroxy-phenyl)propionate/3-hydroxycinnamic acid hydroxylase [Klebsiella pneumoniae]
MTTSTPDIQPAVQHTAQVAIVGAGPVGLMMANYLGQMGISVLVVEKLATLIDYRGPSALTMNPCGRCRRWGW